MTQTRRVKLDLQIAKTIMSSRKFFNINYIASPEAYQDEHALQALLEQLRNIPIAPLARMDLKSEFEFKDAVDFAVLRELLLKNGQRAIEIRSDEPLRFRVSMGKFRTRCTLVLTFSTDHVPEHITAEALIDFLRALWRKLPMALQASAKADTEYSDVMMSNGMPGLIDIFDFFISWLHWLSPAAYQRWYERGVLLGAPVFKAEEQSDGTIFLQAYPGPFDYLDVATIERMMVISTYLHESKKGMNAARPGAE